MYVTTCPVTFQVRVSGPRLSQTQNSHRKREDLIVKNFVIVTPAHPEVVVIDEIREECICNFPKVKSFFSAVVK
jgi:hypothetical protein